MQSLSIIVMNDKILPNRSCLAGWARLIFLKKGTTMFSIKNCGSYNLGRH